METMYYGAPYGINGERGEDVADNATAAAQAESLTPGQSMEVIDGGEVVARYECSADGEVVEVTV